MEAQLVGPQGAHDLSFDAGTGIAGRPIIGVLFWVRSTSAGKAADRGIAASIRAVAASFGEQARLYDAVVIPIDAVVLPDDPGYPGLPD
jgi:hypothetical protein